MRTQRQELVSDDLKQVARCHSARFLPRDSIWQLSGCYLAPVYPLNYKTPISLTCYLLSLSRPPLAWVITCPVAVATPYIGQLANVVVQRNNPSEPDLLEHVTEVKPLRHKTHLESVL